MKTEIIQLQHHKIIRTTNNLGEKAKFHICYIINNQSKLKAVAIHKLTLADFPRKGFKLIRLFKSKYIYFEHISLKPETLYLIADLIKSIS